MDIRTSPSGRQNPSPPKFEWDNSFINNLSRKRILYRLIGITCCLLVIQSLTAEIYFSGDLLLWGRYNKKRSIPFKDYPTWMNDGEVRPRFKLEEKNFLKLSFRPRLVYSINSKTEEKHDLGELFIAATPTDSLILSVGQQNTQWGPSDTWGPSNFLFLEHSFERDPFAPTPWKNMLKISYTPLETLSLIVIQELSPLSNMGPPQVASSEIKEERKKTVLKMELSAVDAPNTLGLVVGAQKRGRPWFGGYGQLEVLEGTLLYAEASYTRMGGFVTASQKLFDETLFPQRGSRHPSSYRGLAGVKYTTLNSIDIKGEFLWNSSGYNEHDFDLIFNQMALNSTNSTTNSTLGQKLAMLTNLGEPFGQKYLLFGVRIPDLGAGKKMTIQEKVVLDLAKNSGFITSAFEYTLTDYSLLYLLLKKSFGTSRSEWGWLNSFSSTVGVKASW